MRKIILTIMTAAFLIMTTGLLPVYAAEDAKTINSDFKLVSMAQQRGEYDVDIRVRLPEKEVGKIRTFMLQLSIQGEVGNPSFLFAEKIRENKEVAVQKSTYNYNSGTKEGIFSIFVSGRASIFHENNAFADLGELKLLGEDEFDKNKAPTVTVSVLDYQIVNANSQEKIDIDYDDAFDAVTLKYYDVESNLANILKEAEAYVGASSGLSESMFAKVKLFTDLRDCYQKALKADHNDSAAMDNAARDLKAAIERFRPVYQLLHILAEAGEVMDQYGKVDCAELTRRFSEALAYLEKNEGVNAEELDMHTRLVKFESMVANVRISVMKAQLSKEEEGRYTQPNLAVWRSAMVNAVTILGKRDTMTLDDIMKMKEDAIAAASALDEAFSGLVDVTELRELIKRAENILAAEEKYSEESIRNLKNAKNSASSFLGLNSVITLESIFNEDGVLVQEGYHGVTARLSAAIDAVKERIKTSEGNPLESSAPGTKPSSSSSPGGSAAETKPSKEEVPGGSTAETEPSGSDIQDSPSQTKETGENAESKGHKEIEMGGSDTSPSNYHFNILGHVAVIIGAIALMIIGMIVYRKVKRRK